ncbi:MAG: recombinase family protein [Lachnospiraceae bacterium]|nr:recombinase family protein [Lachnospiraceae bacterium]
MKKFNIAYIRVSSEEQLTERQRVNILKRCPDAVFVIEKYTGRTMDRPQWNKILTSAEKGHVSSIWFDEPSRMGRTADECFKIYKHLYFDLGVSLHFIKGSHCDTEVYEQALNSSIDIKESKTGDGAADKMINAILGAVHIFMLSMIEDQIFYAFKEAEDEVKNLSARTKSGIEEARRRGKRIGGIKGSHYRSKTEWKAMPLIIKYSREFGGKYDLAGVARITGLTVLTVRKYIENIKIEQGLLNLESAKYADKKDYNMEIQGIDKYKEDAEKIWMERYGKQMKWSKIKKIRKASSCMRDVQLQNSVSEGK